jgi:hypothetical protein
MSAPLAAICLGGQHQPPAAANSHRQRKILSESGSLHWARVEHARPVEYLCGTATFPTRAAEGGAGTKHR